MQIQDPGSGGCGCGFYSKYKNFLTKGFIYGCNKYNGLASHHALYTPVQNVKLQIRQGFGEVSARSQAVTAAPFFFEIQIKLNSNENENKKASGGTCAGGVKRPCIGVFPCCVFAFVFVRI